MTSKNGGCTGITILSAYGVVTTVIIVVLGEVNMGDGGKLTEIHNRVIKVDPLNSDQAETGRIDSNGKFDCPPCTT